MAGTRMKLAGEELVCRAEGLPDWRVEGEARLTKSFTFPDFKSALDFVNRVGEAAEERGHHPDLHLAWGRVDVETSTHDAGGITEADFDLAQAIDRCFARK